MDSFNPAWESRHIENEIIVFTEKDGLISAGLAFDNPRNAVIKDREGNVLKKNVDYIVKGNSVILLNDSLFFYKSEWLLNKNVPEYVKNENEQYNIKDTLLISPEFLRKTQFTAEYDCDRSDFPQIIYKGNLEKTARKISRKQPLTVVLFGDSISNAANSSWDMGFENYAHWMDRVKENVKKYCGAEIIVKNISRSGYGTEWALSAYKEKFNDIKADLVIIAFGMNDGNLGAERFAKNVAELQQGIESIEKNAEFIVVSSPLANKNCCEIFGQKEQFSALYAVFCDITTLIDMGSVSEFLLKRKNYVEISGNNLNHPNDFFYEFYTSAISKVLIDSGKTQAMND